jgi:hypothetical protein
MVPGADQARAVGNEENEVRRAEIGAETRCRKTASEVVLETIQLFKFHEAKIADGISVLMLLGAKQEIGRIIVENRGGSLRT